MVPKTENRCLPNAPDYPPEETHEKEREHKFCRLRDQ